MTAESLPGWAFQLSTDRMVHVSEVPNGKDCGCICPNCASPLLAKQGKKRRWHFAHSGETGDCHGLAETALHKAAKDSLQLLQSGILLPKEKIRRQGWLLGEGYRSAARWRLDQLMTDVLPAQRLSGWTFRIEPTDWRDSGFQPDAILHKDNWKLAIEFRVTHQVDENKLEQLRKAKLPAMEIDLSNVPRNIRRDTLIRMIDSEAPRQWLTTARHKKRQRAEAEFDRHLNTFAGELTRTTPRLLTRNLCVNDCPRRDEPRFESVNVYDCSECQYHFGTNMDFKDTPLWTMLPRRIQETEFNFVFCGRIGFINLPTQKQIDYVLDLAREDLSREGGLERCLPSGWDKNATFVQDFLNAHPNCPQCKTKMVLRRRIRDRSIFWGCPNYTFLGCQNGKNYESNPVLAEILAEPVIDTDRDNDRT